MDIEFSLLSLQRDYRGEEYAGQPPTDVVQLFRSGLGQIEDTVQAMVRATIGDRHHDRFAVLEIHHSDYRPQRKPPASRGQFTTVESLTIGHSPALVLPPVPGGDSDIARF